MKGLNTLILAARTLPENVVVVVAGDGDALEEYRRRVLEVGVANRIVFQGYLTREQCLDQLESASAFCLPSGQEGFGISFLEALALGRPCIGCAAGGVPDVISASVGDIVPYGNPEALSTGIQRVLNRIEVGSIVASEVRAEYLARFSYDRFDRAWKNVAFSTTNG